MPGTNLNARSFARFATGSPASRNSMIASLGQPWNPVHDYYRAARAAIRRDRQSTRDGVELLNLARRSDRAHTDNFTRVAENFIEASSRWVPDGQAHFPRRRIEISGLGISTAGTFDDMCFDGSRETVHVDFTIEPASLLVVTIVLRLMERGLSTEEIPVRPVYLDLATGEAHTSVKHDLDELDVLIDDTAADLSDELGAGTI